MTRSPAATATLGLLLLTGLMGWLIHLRLAGQYAYALDDAYIHLAMAKNLAEHGVWGLTSHGFTSSSSSPAWTLILATAYTLLPFTTSLPLLLNLSAAVALTWVLATILRRDGTPRVPATGITLLTLFAAPIVPLIFSGMEHVTHALAMLLLFDRFSRWLHEPSPSRRQSLQVGLLALIAAGLRYETALLLPFAVVALAVRRRFRDAALFTAAIFLPIVAYGGVSLAMGWNFLPVSVSVKAIFGQSLLDRRLEIILFNLKTAPYLAVAVPFLLALSFDIRHRWASHASALQALASMIVLQIMIGRFGWFFRYEAYLVVLTCWLLGAVLTSPRAYSPSAADPGRRLSQNPRLFTAVLAVAFFGRGVLAHLMVPGACLEIRDQPLLLAQFVDAHDEDEVIAINDVGAVAYFTDAEIVDLAALGTLEIANMRRQGAFNPQTLGPYLERRNVAWIAGWSDWFESALPDYWVPVAQWKLDQRVVVAGDTVTFYARDDSRGELIHRLEQFHSKLPARVTFRVLDTDP